MILVAPRTRMMYPKTLFSFPQAPTLSRCCVFVCTKTAPSQVLLKGQECVIIRRNNNSNTSSYNDYHHDIIMFAILLTLKIVVVTMGIVIYTIVVEHLLR